MTPYDVLLSLVKDHPELVFGLIVVISAVVVVTEFRWLIKSVEPIVRVGVAFNTLATVLVVYAVSISLGFILLALETIFLSMIVVGTLHYLELWFTGGGPGSSGVGSAKKGKGR